MTFNVTAQSLIKHGHARPVSTEECLDLLNVAYDQKLVQFGSNVREKVNFICNCCGCCCEAMIAARRFGLLHPVHTTNFLPEIQEGDCTGCGHCVNVCPVEAISLVSANDPRNPKNKKAQLREETCLGCGLCVRVCQGNHIALKLRSQRVITPLSSVHLAVAMAIERAKQEGLYPTSNDQPLCTINLDLILTEGTKRKTRLLYVLAPVGTPQKIFFPS